MEFRHCLASSLLAAALVTWLAVGPQFDHQFAALGDFFVRPGLQIDIYGRPEAVLEPVERLGRTKADLYLNRERLAPLRLAGGRQQEDKSRCQASEN